MLLCRTLLLLMGLSACTVAGDKKLALGGTEARSWVTMTLEEDVIPSVQLQLQEGCLLTSLQEQTGHQRGQMVQDLPGRRGPSTEGREGEEHW
ncbi:tachykinin-4 isoform X7 [Desmodus rotundus]|uniref:tachykinin-4 isoform X7 n=2 Tax=Desmodus rotundus TaxID=9430 RepID=UPI0023816397|nr:tachykinin-4 isoform X6 [Desmodus rotundus]